MDLDINQCPIQWTMQSIQTISRSTALNKYAVAINLVKPCATIATGRALSES